MNEFEKSVEEILTYQSGISTTPRPTIEIPTAALAFIKTFLETCERHGSTLNVKKVVRDMDTLEVAGRQVTSALGDFDQAAKKLSEVMPKVASFLDEHGEKLSKSYEQYKKMTA